MSAKRLSCTAVLAAIYALTTLLLAPISFGVIQFRISEVLCLLPYYFPGSAWGLFLGCALANLLSGNLADFIFGSLATLLAALLTARMGKRELPPFLCCLSSALINGLIVGAVITGGYEGIPIFTRPGVFALNALSVALGEALVLFLIGLPLLKVLPRHRLYRFLESFFDCTKERL